MPTKTGRPTKRERQEAMQAKAWDALGKLAGGIKEVLLDDSFQRIAGGALSGLAVGWPINSSIASTNRTQGISSELRMTKEGVWYYHEVVEYVVHVIVTPLWTVGLPNVSGDIPTFGVGGIGVGKVGFNMKEWFEFDMPIRVVVEYNQVPGPGGVSDGGVGLAKQKAIALAEGYARLLGTGTGGLAGVVLSGRLPA